METSKTRNRKAMTVLQKFRKFIENDRMQEVYTKEQLLAHIDLLLIPLEKEMIMDAVNTGFKDGCMYSNGEEWEYQSAEHYYEANYTLE